MISRRSRLAIWRAGAGAVAAAIGLVWLGGRTRRHSASTSSEVGEHSPPDTPPPRAEGRYDVRQGAAGYAPIIGAFGALAVPAIIVVFTASVPKVPDRADLVTLTAGLLIVAMIASIIGGIGMAAIGAEQDLTANLVPATMMLSVAVAVALIDVLAAFQVLAAIYLPGTATLFATIVGAAGLLSAFFVAITIADSWQTGPSDQAERERWLQTQWLKSRQQADQHTRNAVLISITPVALGIALRIADIHARISQSTAPALVVVSLALSVASIGLGAVRTRHPLDGRQRGLQPYEAYGSTLIIGMYALLVLIVVP